MLANTTALRNFRVSSAVSRSNNSALRKPFSLEIRYSIVRRITRRDVCLSLLLGAVGRQRRRALGRPAVSRSLLEGVGEADQFRFAESGPGEGHTVGRRIGVEAVRERRRGE